MIEKVNRSIQRQLRWSDWSDQSVTVQTGTDTELEIVVDDIVYTHVDEINDFEIRQIVQKALHEEYTPPQPVAEPIKRQMPPEQRKPLPSAEAIRKLTWFSRVLIFLIILNVGLIVLAARNLGIDIPSVIWRLVVILGYSLAIYGIERRDSVGYWLAHIPCFIIILTFSLLMPLGGYWLFTLRDKEIKHAFGVQGTSQPSR